MSVQTWLGLFVTYLVHDGILLYHRPALHTEPVSRRGIVLDDRPSAIRTHSLCSVRVVPCLVEWISPTINVLEV